MKWTRKGIIYSSELNPTWSSGYAALPVVDLIEDNRVRIYFSVRDKKGRSIPTFIEVEAKNPKNILYKYNKPILSLGNLGTFDDNGIMPSSIVEVNGLKYLYYIGWNPQKTVSYRLSIGLAVSKDGVNFKKLSPGPIMDRSVDEPFFNTAPFVIRESDKWKMWYVSCTGWEIINDWPEPLYNVKYAVSNDGINWKRTGITCIDYDSFTKAIGKPYVFIENGIYKMIYSYRNIIDYRKDRNSSYRLGLAESKDGVAWSRKDRDVGIFLSEKGWDSIMMEYCTGYFLKKKHFLMYNGNGFGESGIGYLIRSIN